MSFVHLNVHSKASMLYGSADISELVARAKELGQSAIALTDYSNLFNAIVFYREATNANIKPILGVDVFFCEDAEQLRLQGVRQVNHLVLLAENDIGWQNICRIVSHAHDVDHFFYRPRVDFTLLEKFKEGIICLSGNSLDSIISYNLFDKTIDNEVSEPAALFKAEGIVRRLLRIFDKDHLFLEVQDTGLAEQAIINDRLRSLSKKYGIRTVATNNVHYVNRHDAEAHRTLLSMTDGKFNRSTLTGFDKEEYYLKSRDEMTLLAVLPDELDATQAIADRCNVKIDLAVRRLPTYQFVPEGKTSMAYLRELAYDGLLEKCHVKVEQKYRDRLDVELADIEEMGFADYFLIVHDVVNWIHQQGILLGRGRGSAGGSLVSYCLGITDIDPLEYGLIWERFLNKGRGGLPDIDTDVPRSRRQEVLEYIRERFGRNNVAQLVTLGGLQAKAILKEVFRAYDMPFDEANAITALVPAKNDEHVPITLQEAIDSVPALKKYYDQYTPWFKVALALEGCYKTTGIHAAAVVISDVPFDVSSYPLTRSKDGDLIFGWDMNTVDTLNLLKLDILGLTTLDDIQETIKLVQQRHNIRITRSEIPLDDPVTWAMIGNGFTVGVFQIEKQLGKTWSKNLKPETIEELSDIISLIRPGPMEGGMHTQYRDVKINNAEPSYIHNRLESILNSTHSALLYQEQVIYICQQLAGMSSIDADKVRKAMGKKKPDEMRKWRQLFVDGCAHNDIDVATAEEIWSYIEKFAGYGFNKSHGVGYALLAYETAYLKANYAIEFLCVKLRHAESHPDKFEQLSALVFDAKLFDIEVVPPRVNLGNKDFSILDDHKIAFGLSALKGVGAGAITDLIKASKAHFKFDDFLWHCMLHSTKINSGVMTALIKGGAFDDCEEHRVRALAKYKLLESLTKAECANVYMLMEKHTDIKDWVRFIRALSDDSRVELIKEKYQIKVPNVRRRATLREHLKLYDSAEIFDTRAQNIAWEQHYLGISLSGSEADIYKSRHKCVDLVKNGYPSMGFELAICVDAMREIVTKKGDPMAFLTVRDNTYVMDNVVVFPRTFANTKHLLEAGNVLKIIGKLDDRGSLIADRIERLK